MQSSERLDFDTFSACDVLTMESEILCSVLKENLRPLEHATKFRKRVCGQSYWGGVVAFVFGL